MQTTLAERSPLRPRPLHHTAQSALTVVQRWEFAIGLLCVGVITRLVQYLGGRSLWGDEAFLALNLISRSYSGLLEPLDYLQVAPPGFLLLEKVAVVTLGSGEHSLRLLPLLCGLTSLPLFYAVARRVLEPLAVPFALLLFSVTP